MDDIDETEVTYQVCMGCGGLTKGSYTLNGGHHLPRVCPSCKLQADAEAERRCQAMADAINKFYGDSEG